jgi:hypothetical protein
VYSYSATLRIHDGGTLTVGPNRRVVFKNRLLALRKDEVKRVLRPLSQYWGEDDPAKLKDRKRDPERPLMSFMQFKGAAKRLLMEAGMLRNLSTEE